MKCQDRWVRDGKNCHSKCEKYKRWKAENDDLLQKKYARNKLCDDLKASRSAALKYIESRNVK